MKTRNQSWLLFHLFCALSLYSLGTAMMDYFLVYPSRLIIGEAEFIEYHALLERAIISVSVLPFLIITLMNIALLWLRPESVPIKLLIASLICLLLDWMSSVFIQIPMNLELNNGKNPALIQKVMDTNWGRIVLEIGQGLIILVMLQRSVRSGKHRSLPHADEAR